MLIAAVILAAGGLIVWEWIISPQLDLQRYPVAFAEIIEKNAVEFGVPRELVFAVVRTESSFNPDAMSHAGAKGLMQLMDDTNAWVALMCGEEECLDEIFTPELNIRRGVWLLAHHYKEFGGWREALAAYNAGFGRVKGWLADPAYTNDGRTLSHIPIGETRAYVEKVMEAAEKYREIYFD